MSIMPTRRLVVLIIANVLTTLSVLTLVGGVATGFLRPYVLVAALLSATEITWMIWSDGRRGDHMDNKIDGATRLIRREAALDDLDAPRPIRPVR